MNATMEKPETEAPEEPTEAEQTSEVEATTEPEAQVQPPAPSVPEPKKPFDIVQGVEAYIAKAIEDAENEEETITAKVLRQRNSVARLSIAMLRMDQGKKTIKERYEEAVELLDSMEKDAAREAEDAKFQPDLPFGEKQESATAPKLLEWLEVSESEWTAWASIGVPPSPLQFKVTKIADGQYDVAQSDTKLLPEEDPGTFESLELAQNWCQCRDSELYGAAHPELRKTDDGAPDPRLSIRLETLGIKVALLTKLAEHEPPLLTVGDIANWTNQKSTKHGGNNSLTDIVGVGEAKATEIQKALDGVWFDAPPTK